ncbi:hypothetical protein KIN20_035552 [Parelaphostrongylus tenuis]|uniref:Uncharacterized protein n=1 Tax=Parelaphostrongylus tenuis TaxID=148309 RepID=A0AAD5WJS9_PARTN|nr:hypothetical protein KIN20_035552 [Parelaphostrongylus tenuis]
MWITFIDASDTRDNDKRSFPRRLGGDGSGVGAEVEKEEGTRAADPYVTGGNGGDE